MSRRSDGRRCWPTSAAYGAIAAHWGTLSSQRAVTRRARTVSEPQVVRPDGASRPRVRARATASGGRRARPRHPVPRQGPRPDHRTTQADESSPLSIHVRCHHSGHASRVTPGRNHQDRVTTVHPAGREARTSTSRSTAEGKMCQHQPRCPDWSAPDHLAARIVADQPGQGWSLLCNGVILFDDGGELLPDRRAAAPGRLDLTGLAAMAA